VSKKRQRETRPALGNLFSCCGIRGWRARLYIESRALFFGELIARAFAAIESRQALNFFLFDRRCKLCPKNKGFLHFSTCRRSVFRSGVGHDEDTMVPSSGHAQDSVSSSRER